MRSIALLALTMWLAGAGPAGAAGDSFETFGVQALPGPVPSPPLTLPDLTGRMVAVPDAFGGQVILLGFFTTT